MVVRRDAENDPVMNFNVIKSIVVLLKNGFSVCTFIQLVARWI